MARASKSPSSSNYLDGQLLVAMPSMMDPRFARAVIYLCAHSPEGAMGIVVNHPATNISFSELLAQLKIIPKRQRIQLPRPLPDMSVQVGGPVETGRGFVLHTSDYFREDATLSINGNVCLTASIDILRDIAKGAGPDRALLALGYAGWAPGQLENELSQNGWLNCPADPDLVFDTNLEGKYVKALATIGIDPGRLVGDAGHA